MKAIHGSCGPTALQAVQRSHYPSTRSYSVTKKPGNIVQSALQSPGASLFREEVTLPRVTTTHLPPELHAIRSVLNLAGTAAATAPSHRNHQVYPAQL